MPLHPTRTSFTALLLLAALAGPALAEENAVIVQSTTSTANSGLYDDLLPQFLEATGVTVHVVAVGTGQAIANAKNCDGDVLLVHDPEAEAAFVAEGFGVERHPLMHNDFVVIGPAADPAGISDLTDAPTAFARIAAAKAPFASRGDNSGTHRKELALWVEAGADPLAASGTWYRETGSGMGATLNLAQGMGAYALTDRATWVSFGNKADLALLVEGDPKLFNPYGVILIDPVRCPNVRDESGQIFIDWLISPEGQAAIATFRVDGQQLFFPDAE